MVHRCTSLFETVSLSAVCNWAEPRRQDAVWFLVLTTFSGVLNCPTIAKTYVASDLYTLIQPAGFIGNVIIDNTTSGPGQVASLGTASNGNQHALVFTGPNGTAIDLHPTLLSGFNTSQAQGTNGSQQVGLANVQSTGLRHAMLWNGTANSAVDLNPTNLSGISDSGAWSTIGTQQVGAGGGSGTGSLPHALRWSGTANSAVDLQPTNLSTFTKGSAAYGTDGTHQVGEGYVNSTTIHALLWTGLANSAVDLNPTNLSGYSQSSAEAVSGNQQVGLGVGSSTGGNTHAMLWSGTASSSVDLNPTNLGGFSTSFIKSTNGTQQVGTGSGSATGGNDHALLWSGAANSAVDLHLLLPAGPGFTNSNADSIDAQGNVFGEAVDSAGVLHAIEWSLLVGDYNGNGIVDAADYVLWRGTLGSTSNLAADGNGNHSVDAGDYTAWRSHFGQHVSGAAIGTTSVPEPTTAMLIIGLFFVPVIRRPKSSRILFAQLALV